MTYVSKLTWIGTNLKFTTLSSKCLIILITKLSYHKGDSQNSWELKEKPSITKLLGGNIPKIYRLYLIKMKPQPIQICL